MATYKRISGDYTIQTLNVGDEITFTSSNVAVSGNLQISGGNVIANAGISASFITAGNITATGNITGGQFYGNGAGLTGVVAVANIGTSSELINGTTSFNIPVSGGNVLGSVNGVANVYVFSDTGVNVAGYVSSNTVVTTGNITGGNIITAGFVFSNTVTASDNVTGGNIITAGFMSATGVILSASTITGGNLATAGLLNVTGNITGGNIVTAGLLTATGNVIGGNIVTAGQVSSNTVTATNNITGGNIVTAGFISATGNILGGNLNVTGNIVVTGALSVITGSNGNITLAPNGTGNINTGANIMPTANSTANIGSTNLRYNTIFAQATTALYADLAECYAADADYLPGTVVMFGGSAEVTICNHEASAKVAGVISTNPAYKMNSGLESNHVATVALVGRVPVQVQGSVEAGDMMVSAGNGRARAEINPAMGTVIGKAVSSFNGQTGTVEIVVGRL